MKQILQNLGSGETFLAEVPCPVVRPGTLLIRSASSLVSLGTERMLVEFGKAGWLDKALQQPDKVQQVLQKIKTDGLMPTIDAVKAKLDQPLPLGYCSAGVVMEVGEGVSGYAVGDRVISNGSHAEVVRVPVNLCAKIPDSVSFEDAAFTVLASIALQGVRLAKPEIGERFVVFGLGLVGQLAVQLLLANGVEVLGVDLDEKKCQLARERGATVVNIAEGGDPVAAAIDFSGGRGADAAVVTASTKSSDPINQAAEACRQRGRVIQVGATGMELKREQFYRKEIAFQVSCSYGPGRYDDEYELKGRDYPFGFVRWTEGRNFEAVLQLMAKGGLDPRPLVSRVCAFDEALQAYGNISESATLGILLRYDRDEKEELKERVVKVSEPEKKASTGEPVTVGVLGAGNFVSLVLLPALKAAGASLERICSTGGTDASVAAKKFGVKEATSDAEALLAHPGMNTLVVGTPHSSHAKYVIEGLRAGKRVFVEKPLCINHGELDQVKSAYTEADAPFVMVGFNRRFAPHSQRLKALLQARSETKSLIFTVNAGAVPDDHWTKDPKIGGGRIIGEGCHFIDLLRFLVGEKITGVTSTMAHAGAGGKRIDDIAMITLEFADGSVGAVHYLANGSKAFPKERLDVFCGGGVIQLDNFRKMTGYGWPGVKKMNLRRQEKGHREEIQAVVDAIRKGRAAPIPFDEIVEVTEVSLKASNLF